MKKLEIFFKNIILNLLLILSRGRISSGKTVFGSNSNVLFIRLNRIGDALVTTPLLTQVKKQTGFKIYVMADKKNYFIFEHCPAVERTFIYKKGLVGLKEMKRLLKNKKIDSIVDLHDDVSLTVSLFLWYVKCQQVFGLKKRNENLYTHTVSRLESTKYHIVERTLELAKLFGLKPDFQNAFINYKFNTVSKKLAEQYLNTLNSKFLLGINITAGSKARFWGKSNFIKLIEEIRRFDINYVVFTTTDYFEQAKKIAPEKNIFPPSQDFDIFAAGISKLNMLFTPDTSIVHIASMIKIPVFGMYVKYNTNDRIWSPYNTEFEYIVTEDPTLHNIGFEEVRNKFIPFLEKHLNG